MEQINTVDDAIRFLERTGLKVLFRVIDVDDVLDDPLDGDYSAEEVIEFARQEQQIVSRVGIPLPAEILKGGVS